MTTQFDFMCKIMEFIVNLLLMRGKLLTNVAAETLQEVIRKCLLFKRKIMEEHSVMNSHDNMLEVVNFHAREYVGKESNCVVTCQDYQMIKVQEQSSNTVQIKTNPLVCKASPMRHRGVGSRSLSSDTGVQVSPPERAEEDLEDNLNAILSAQEVLLRNIMRMVSVIEKKSSKAQNVRLKKIKEKILACQQILSSRQRIETQRINNIVEEETARCRFATGETKTSGEINLKSLKVDGLGILLDPLKHVKKPATNVAGVRQPVQEAKIKQTEPSKNYQNVLEESITELDHYSKVIEANLQHFSNFENKLWHTITTAKYLSLKDEYKNMVKCAFYNRRQFTTVENQISNKIKKDQETEYYQKLSPMLQVDLKPIDNTQQSPKKQTVKMQKDNKQDETALGEILGKIEKGNVPPYKTDARKNRRAKKPKIAAKKFEEEPKRKSVDVLEVKSNVELQELLEKLVKDWVKQEDNRLRINAKSDSNVVKKENIKKMHDMKDTTNSEPLIGISYRNKDNLSLKLKHGQEILKKTKSRADNKERNLKQNIQTPLDRKVLNHKKELTQKKKSVKKGVMNEPIEISNEQLETPEICTVKKDFNEIDEKIQTKQNVEAKVIKQANLIASMKKETVESIPKTANVLGTLKIDAKQSMENIRTAKDNIKEETTRKEPVQNVQKIIDAQVLKEKILPDKIGPVQEQTDKQKLLKKEDVTANFSILPEKKSAQNVPDKSNLRTLKGLDENIQQTAKTSDDKENINITEESQQSDEKKMLKKVEVKEQFETLFEKKISAQNISKKSSVQATLDGNKKRDQNLQKMVKISDGKTNPKTFTENEVQKQSDQQNLLKKEDIKEHFSALTEKKLAQNIPEKSNLQVLNETKVPTQYNVTENLKTSMDNKIVKQCHEQKLLKKEDVKKDFSSLAEKKISAQSIPERKTLKKSDENKVHEQKKIGDVKEFNENKVYTLSERAKTLRMGDVKAKKQLTADSKPEVNDAKKESVQNVPTAVKISEFKDVKSFNDKEVPKQIDKEKLLKIEDAKEKFEYLANKKISTENVSKMSTAKKPNEENVPVQNTQKRVKENIKTFNEKNEETNSKIHFTGKKLSARSVPVIIQPNKLNEAKVNKRAQSVQKVGKTRENIKTVEEKKVVKQKMLKTDELKENFRTTRKTSAQSAPKTSDLKENIQDPLDMIRKINESRKKKTFVNNILKTKIDKMTQGKPCFEPADDKKLSPQKEPERKQLQITGDVKKDALVAHRAKKESNISTNIKTPTKLQLEPTRNQKLVLKPAKPLNASPPLPENSNSDLKLTVKPKNTMKQGSVPVRDYKSEAALLNVNKKAFDQLEKALNSKMILNRSLGTRIQLEPVRKSASATQHKDTGSRMPHRKIIAKRNLTKMSGDKSDTKIVRCKTFVKATQNSAVKNIAPKSVEDEMQKIPVQKPFSTSFSKRSTEEKRKRKIDTVSGRSSKLAKFSTSLPRRGISSGKNDSVYEVNWEEMDPKNLKL